MTRISIAPMVDVTDKYFRYFCRLLTKRSYLYTEMITAQAIIHGDRNKLLDFDSIEKPIVLQIAGCEAKEVAEAVKIAEDWDYDEINLNVGCPSDRVSGNQMGATLMAYPELVAEMVYAMKKETKKPVSIKHRIGIDGTNILPDTLPKIILDGYDDMEHFVNIIKQVGINHFIVHARIAILEGLSPRENRDIPPIRYEEVYKLKKSHPELFIEINGGIRDTDSIKEHLKYVDGVMIGRAAYEDSVILSQLDKFIDGNSTTTSRREVIEGLMYYMNKLDNDRRMEYQALRSTLGLFHNQRGSRTWRQLLTPPWTEGNTAKQMLEKALREIPIEVLDERI